MQSFSETNNFAIGSRAVTVDGMRRAGFWLRALALGIDLLLASALAAFIGIAVFFIGPPAQFELAQYLYELTWLALLLAYTSFEAWVGRSPGKMLLRLRIAYPDGAPADRWTLLLRWCTKWSGFLVALCSAATLHPTLLDQLAGFMNMVILVGCLQALDEDKRAWHDQWSKTAVFRRLRQTSTPGVPSIAPALA